MEDTETGRLDLDGEGDCAEGCTRHRTCREGDPTHPERLRGHVHDFSNMGTLGLIELVFDAEAELKRAQAERDEAYEAHDRAIRQRDEMRWMLDLYRQGREPGEDFSPTCGTCLGFGSFEIRGVTYHCQECGGPDAIYCNHTQWQAAEERVATLEGGIRTFTQEWEDVFQIIEPNEFGDGLTWGDLIAPLRSLLDAPHDGEPSDAA